MTITATRPITAGIDTRAASDSEFTRRFVATTSGVKRDGLDIDLQGMSTDNFMRNPVFLYVHDYFGERLPLGRVTKIGITKTKMNISVLFDEGDPFAMEVLRKYDAGFLNAVSIGWETIDFDRESRRVVESDLLDISAVPVPGDPDALMMRQRSMLRSLGQELLDKFDVDIKCAVCSELIPADEEVRSIPDPDGSEFNVIACVDCADGDLQEWVDEQISGLAPEQTAGLTADERQAANQEDESTEEVDQMERLEQVVATLDAFRTALSALIDSADVDDTDGSLTALLRAFPEPNVIDDEPKGDGE